ncbi:radical SAM protein [Agarivorans sp. QJM3NY_33]|uniref:radical SAM protein n=1 Tax=Agarivorans sp. QJM3NY_33 TaxID=3421432 RepID=UPI003D7D94DE
MIYSEQEATNIHRNVDFEANATLWLNCNLRCPYCFANPISPPKKWSTEVDKQLSKLSDFLNKTGKWSLNFSGGEPTIYPHFASFLPFSI